MLRVLDEQFVKASVELRRLEKYLNWEAMVAIAELKWKNSLLGDLYHDYVKECLARPLVHAAIITGSEETLRRIIAKSGMEVLKGLDLSHPIYKLAVRPVEDVLARLTADTKEDEVAQIIEGDSVESQKVTALVPAR